MSLKCLNNRKQKTSIIKNYLGLDIENSSQMWITLILKKRFEWFDIIPN